MNNEKPELNITGDGKLTTENLEQTIRNLEHDLDAEREERWQYQYKLKQANQTLRKHGLSVEDLVDGDVDPEELNELNDEPLNRSRLEWQEFPLEVLPAPVQNYSHAQSKAMCVDPAMIAVPSLAVLSAAVGNSRHVQIKSNWRESPTIWTAIIQASGALKSPTQQKALAPTFHIERGLKKEWEKQLSQWKKKDDEKRGPKPTRERRLVDDATVESVALLHDDHPRGLLLYRDELAGWLGSFNQYNRGDSDLQKWIEFYEGRTVEVDRKSTDRPAIFIEHPFTAVTGTIQPEVLEDRLDSIHFQSGFVARILLCEPPERPRRFNDHSVRRETKEAYYNLIERLYELSVPTRDGMIVDQDLSLSGEAQNIFGEFFNSCERLKEKPRSGPLRAMVSKNQALGARLALIFQLCKDPRSDEIERDAMIGGATLARWFRHEGARIYQNHGFHERGVSRDRQLSKSLPKGTFGVEKIADIWNVTKRGGYKVRDRLIDQGLLEKVGHGEYRSLVAEGKLDPFQYFSDTPDS